MVKYKPYMVPPAATLPHAKKFFVKKLLNEKKDSKAIALFPTNKEFDKFNELVSTLLVEDESQFEVLKAEDEGIDIRKNNFQSQYVKF